MEQTQYDVLIIGAGIVGCSIAYYLTHAGFRVALVDKGGVAEEATAAGAGLLAPLGEEDVSDSVQQRAFYRLCLQALNAYRDLDQKLKSETGIAIELINAPVLRPAFEETQVAVLQKMHKQSPQNLPGLKWLDGQAAREQEPLLARNVLGALISPAERNVNAVRVAQAYARGAAEAGAQIFEGRAAARLIRQGSRVVGIATARGPLRASTIILATGAWSADWHSANLNPPVFPVKGQMLALRSVTSQPLRHSILDPWSGTILPKATGSIFVGSTVEMAGFDKNVTAEGLATLLGIVEKIAPSLKQAQFERAWSGLRPGSVDSMPLLGQSHSAPGLWLACGLFRNGILLAPLVGQIVAALLQEKPVPCDLDLAPFDPDRVGNWGEH